MVTRLHGGLERKPTTNPTPGCVQFTGGSDKLGMHALASLLTPHEGGFSEGLPFRLLPERLVALLDSQPLGHARR